MDLGNDTEKETGWAYGGNGCQATENHVRDENDQSVLVDGRKTGEPADRMTFVIAQRGNRVAGGGGES
jgi:hypothetical protein